MRYEGNPKHKHPWQRGRRGALCPKEIGEELAQRLLEDSQTHEGKRFATWEGRAFCAQKHADSAWHGYPVGWREVPQPVRRRWLQDGTITRRQVREYW